MAHHEQTLDGARRRAHPSLAKPAAGSATAGAAVCVARSLERADRRVAVRQRGGQVGRAAVVPEPQRSTRSTEDVFGLAPWTTAAWTGRVDVRIADADDGLTNAAGRFCRR
jgi:hypothetical protein